MNFRLLITVLAALAFVGAGCARETPPAETPAATQESAPPLSVTLPLTNEAVDTTAPSGVTPQAGAPAGTTPELSAPGTPPPVAPVPPPPPLPGPEPESTSKGQSAPASQIIVMDNTGFVPSTVTVPVGTTVTFLNQGPSPRWPASGVHPAHQLCPGFDALGGIMPGGSYSFTFREKKTCPMHDHLSPGTRGSIIVE